MSTQTKVDDALKSLAGIKFFISSCTATSTKTKSGEYCFGVSYFIVLQKSRKITHDKIFDLIYDQEELDVAVTSIKTRNTSKMEDTEVILAKLKQVVKVCNF